MNEIQKANEALDKFLEKHPKLQEYQKEIDDILNKTPAHLRMDVLITMILGKMQELQLALIELEKEGKGKNEN